MSKTGYMLFKADSDPMRPHPDVSPDERPVTFDAAGFFLAYHCHDALRDALLEAQEDHAAVKEAVAAGDLRDADDMAVVRPVEVGDDGSVRVFDYPDRTEICRYSLTDMYEEFFGMAVPEDDMPAP